MVCSCAMPSNSVWMQIIFCSCVKETVLFSFLRSLLRSISLPKDIHWKNKLSDRMIKQLLNSRSVIAKYRDLSVSRTSITCPSLQLRQIIDLLATDKTRYFAQPRPIIVNSFLLRMANLLIFIHTVRIWKVTIQLRLKNGTHFSCYESVPKGYNVQMRLCLTLTWDTTRFICGGLKNVYSHPSPRKNRFGSLVKNALHILWARETEHPTYPNLC